jgi:hypothetical protein
MAGMSPATTAFEELQTKLGPAMALNTPGATGEHVVITLPSFSLGESLLHHYGDRIPSLEHRYLVAMLMLHRFDECEMLFVLSEAPRPEILDYYISLVPASRRTSVGERFRVVGLGDRTHRAVAAKLLDRPDLVQRVRDLVGGRPAYIEPWNVTDAEVEVALALDVPIYGNPPELWPLGFKSAGRRLFAEANVPVPFGQENVCTREHVREAIGRIRESRPRSKGVVIKHDNSGAGDGNVVVDLSRAIEPQLAALPDWYVEDLALGGIVEERITGDQFASPSVQLDIWPDGVVELLSTHEQVLGGETGQVYTGCTFPADTAYAAELAQHGRRVGERLATLGVMGRASVDFVAARSSGEAWRLFALEINLRKGGTTHPYAVLRNLAPGTYDEDLGRWVAEDGKMRAYSATDNLIDEAWTGLPPSAVIGAVDQAGIGFDDSSGTGVVLHMLTGLAVDGRVGLTAIGHTADEASDLQDATRHAIDRCTRSRARA